MEELRYYLLRIALSEIKPEIWRRFAVPSSITLDKLHDVIQKVMDWHDRHLHKFIVNKKTYTKYPDLEWGLEELDAHYYSLSQLAKKKGKVIEYVYDLGDHWQHTITIEDIDYKVENPNGKAFFIEGKNATPPENCGGVYGFEQFREVITNPEHEAYQEYLEWFQLLDYPDKKYNPKKCNITRINKQLAKLSLERKSRVCIKQVPKKNKR